MGMSVSRSIAHAAVCRSRGPTVQAGSPEALAAAHGFPDANSPPDGILVLRRAVERADAKQPCRRV